MQRIRINLNPTCLASCARREFWDIVLRMFPCEIMTASIEAFGYQSLSGSSIIKVEVPFGKPVVPLEKAMYASVFFFAGCTFKTAIFFVRASSINCEKFLCPGSSPVMMKILVDGRSISFAIGSAIDKNFTSMNRHVALDNVNVFFSSNGFE